MIMFRYCILLQTDEGGKAIGFSHSAYNSVFALYAFKIVQLMKGSARYNIHLKYMLSLASLHYHLIQLYVVVGITIVQWIG